MAAVTRSPGDPIRRPTGSRGFRPLSHGRQRLFEIGQQVAEVFDAEPNSHLTKFFQVDPTGAWGHNRSMAAVKVRNVPDSVVDALKALARQNGRSMEEHLRRVLADSILQARRVGAENITVLHNRLSRKYGELSDSTPQIRADREARG